MLKRIILFFKAGWICDAVTKIADGIAAAVVVINHVIEQVTGSEAGDKIGQVLETVLTFLTAVHEVVLKIQSFTCGKQEDVEATTYSVDGALDKLKEISDSLKG